jgi:uncharacterized protein (TIGR00369 family)
MTEHPPTPASSATASPADTLAAWNAQLEAVRAHTSKSGAGITRRELVAAKSGLELMQGVLRGEFPYPPIADTLDFYLVEVAFGKAVFQGTPQYKHFNPMGSVHGGWFATLLDSALGCSVHTTLPQGRAYTTTELSVNLVRAAHAGTGPLRAIGTVLHSGRQLATAEARLVGPDGKLYAHATTTCMVFDMP